MSADTNCYLRLLAEVLRMPVEEIMATYLKIYGDA